ncbi:hypothetical protein SVIOM342S_01822 [Streptomyces violaceorubidus]
MDYYDLGGHGRPVTTSSPEAQRWFDRGLVWTYAFHHEEAVACFETAAAADPDCAMAHWGIAHALGPNYNKPWEAFDTEELTRTVDRTHAAVERAHGLAGRATPVERALIGALRARYPQASAVEDCSVWNAPYADSMRAVYELAPDDLDVATLYADALMNLTPWRLWDLRTGLPAEGARTLAAKEVLDRALAADGGRDHPGVLHLCIHLMEMSPTPEAALTVADRLRGLVPDAGHLLHMPSHLEVLCGDYRRVVSDNEAAIAADEKYRARSGAMNFYTLYRAHNHHFRIYGAMFLGQYRVALDTAARLEASVPEDLLRVESPPMADWLEGFLAMRVHVLIRFGRWADILALPRPADPRLYCVTTAMLHYAPRRRRSRPPAGSRRRRQNANCSARPSPGCRSPGRCSTTPVPTSSPSPRPCSTANWSTAGATTPPPSPPWNARSSWTTASPTTSPGGGCSPPGTPAAPCSWNRAGSPRPRRSDRADLLLPARHLPGRRWRVRLLRHGPLSPPGPFRTARTRVRR